MPAPERPTPKPDLRSTLAVTALALVNLGLVVLVTAGVAAILYWAHPDATDIAQWSAIALLGVRAFVTRRRPAPPPGS